MSSPSVEAAAHARPRERMKTEKQRENRVIVRQQQNLPVGENWTHLTLISGLVFRELKSPGMEFWELDNLMQRDDVIVYGTFSDSW